MKEDLKKRILTIDRIVEIDSGIQQAAECDFLDSRVSYRLSRLQGWCTSVVKTVQREQARLTIARTDIQSLDKEIRDEIVSRSNQAINELMEIEEEIPVPEFKLSDFTARQDMEVNIRDREGKITRKKIDKGQAMMPQGFFNLMGDLIIDDLDANPGMDAPSQIGLTIRSRIKDTLVEIEQLKKRPPRSITNTTPTKSPDEQGTGITENNSGPAESRVQGL